MNFTNGVQLLQQLIVSVSTKSFLLKYFRDALETSVGMILIKSLTKSSQC